MSNKQKYIALPGGKECKPINPFSRLGIHALSWQQFEANSPTYTLTEVMPEGVEFIGSQLMKESFNGGKTWVDCRVDGYDPICSIGAIHKVFVKPLKAKEPVKQEYDVIMKTYTPVCPTVYVVENKETVEDRAIRAINSKIEQRPSATDSNFNYIHQEWAFSIVRQVIRDCTHDNHASFVALVEGAIKNSDKPNGRLPDSTAGWNNALQYILNKIK